MVEKQKTTEADVQEVLERYMADNEDIPNGAFLIGFLVGGEYMYREGDKDVYSRFYTTNEHATPSSSFGLASLIQSDVSDDIVGTEEL